MSASTNASSGYSITVDGPTLTCNACSSSTIDAIGASAAASSPGTEQFGFRVGVSSGTGSAASPYNTANYAFDSGATPDTVATGDGDEVSTTFDLYYLANIASTTEAGDYQTTLTYTITAQY